jgi:hypothetical protein
MSLVGLVIVGCLALGLPTGALAASQPAIESVSVSFVTQHDAGLEATINPKGLSVRGAVYQFQVVANPSEYLSEIACPVREHSLRGGGGCIGAARPGVLPIGFIPKGAGGKSVSVELNAAGMDLKPGTTYHYRVLAATAKASEDQLEWEAPPAYSEDQTFTTPPAKTTTTPMIDSESASHVTATDTTLEAKINPENLKRGALYQFQLVGNTNEYLPVFVCPTGWAHSSICLGLDTEVEGLPTGVTHAGQEIQVVSLDLGSAGVRLRPGTTYHYRVIAATSVLTEDTTDWEGPIVEGSDQTFTVPLEGHNSPSGQAEQEPKSEPPTPLVTPLTVISPPIEATTKPPPLTRAQRLAGALRRCQHKPRRRRAICEGQAHGKYGVAAKTGKQAKK